MGFKQKYDLIFLKNISIEIVSSLQKPLDYFFFKFFFVNKNVK